MRIGKKKLEQLRTFKKDTGNGLQYLLNKAYRILENPVILYDADFKILAQAAGVFIDGPVWNHHIKDEAVVKNSDIFVNEGFFDLMFGPEKVVLLKSENLKYDRIFGKICDKNNNLLAGVSIVAADKPFENDDLMVAEAICKILADEIIKLPDYLNYARSKMESCINMLIDGEYETIEDKLHISGYVAMVYKGLKDNLYLAVADITQCDPTHTKLDYYKNLFEQARPAFKYSNYSNYIVILMSTDEAILHLGRLFNRLNRLFEQHQIKVGVSSRFENLFDLSKYYNEAVQVLTNGLTCDSDKSIFVYHDES